VSRPRCGLLPELSKGGKRLEILVHHKAEEYLNLNAHLEGAGIYRVGLKKAVARVGAAENYRAGEE
jgi:hypothetical protein